MRRAVVVVNPAARRGARAERAFRDACARLGIPCEVHRTAAPGDAATIAARLAPTLDDGEPLFAIGGDGTIVEVVGAVGAHAARGVAVGVLAGGTGNQLAKILGVPRHAGRALERYIRARGDHGAWSFRAMDLGLLGDGRVFALTAGLGLDAGVIRWATRRLKRIFGVGAYFIAAARVILTARDFPARVVADGRVVERAVGLAFIANVGALFPGPMPIGPRSIADDDGFLDVGLVTLGGPLGRISLALKVLTRDFRDDHRMLFLRAKEVRIEARANIPAQADGELLSPGCVEARVLARAARFLAPYDPGAPSERAT